MKKMLFSLLVSAAIGCNQPAAHTDEAKAPVDSLMNVFGDSWNAHDSAAVRNLFSEEVLLIDDNLVAGNANEMSEKWISPNIRVVTNFKATKLQDWSNNDRASFTGKYNFDAVVNDSVVAQPKGAFTFIWQKNSDGKWKITSGTIHSFTSK